MRALIVDDSRFIRELLFTLLDAEGIECVAAAHGREALERLRVDPAFDVALIDWNMPVMGGLELVKTLRAMPAFAKMKILMVTTESENEFIEASLEAGADEYLMKPFDEQALLEKLQMVGLVED